MYKRGTIILVPFPFTDLSGSKVRPAVIVSDGAIGDDVTVLFITAQPKLRGKHLVPIAPDNTNGLKTASKIVCSKLATLETKIVLGELGRVSPQVQLKIDATVRSVLCL